MFQGKIHATIGTVDNVAQLELRGLKVNVIADPLELGVPTPASDISSTRPFLANRHNRAKAFLRAFCEAIWLGRNDKEVAFRVYWKYMRIDEPKLLDSMHRNYLLTSIPVKPIITQAKKEPELVFVAGASTFGGRQAFAELQSAFNKRFGLNARINFSAGPSMPAMAARIISEAKAGTKSSTDVHLGPPVTHVELRNEGLLSESTIRRYSLG
jgi:hypothetical protein